MTMEKWPERDTQQELIQNNPVNTTPDYGDRRYEQQVRPSNGFRLRQALAGPAARRVLGRSAAGAKLLGVTRWFWIAEWGALAIAVGLALLALVGYIQKDFLLSTIVLVIAGLAVGVWLIVRAVRRFVERQIARAFAQNGKSPALSPTFSNCWHAARST